MSTLHGLRALAHDAVDRTVDLVALGHETAASAIVGALSLWPPLAGPAQQVDALRRGLTGGVLDAVRGANALASAATAAALGALHPARPADESPLPLRSDLVGQPAWIADATRGLLNGVIGDHLARTQNPLDAGLRLRGPAAFIEPDGRGIPAEAGPRVAILVHGLGGTDWSWCLDAARLHGDPTVHLGQHLQSTHFPVLVRYNTGRAIADSAAALSEALDALLLAWPVPIRELLLIGHSMGGLVLRSALHQAHRDGASWVCAARTVITLGSPLQGAPLEALGHALLQGLDAIPHPAPAITAAILRGRSAGIQDLRTGEVGPADRPLPLPDHLDWHFVAGLHPLGEALGDGMVTVESASGPADRPARSTTHRLPGVSHLELPVHPSTFRLLDSILSPPEPP